MAFKHIFFLVIALVAMAGAGSGFAQDLQFNPNSNCRTVLSGDTGVAAFWAFGYLAHQSQRPRSVDAAMIANFLGDFVPACNATPKASFITVLDRLMAGPDAETEMLDAADNLVELFDVLDIDLVQVIRSMKPTPIDIRTVYAEPLATSLIDRYEDAFGPDLDEAGFPSGPFEIVPEFTTTLALAQSRLLNELPGGYQRVLEMFLVDVPFGRLVLTFPGEDDRVKLNGLTFVNRHWVIMPRPWRALE